MSDYELDQNEIHALDNAEKLNWDENYFEKIKGVEPGTKYGAVSESLRHNISEKQACVLGCKGKDCKYCNPTGPKAPWKPEDMEIKGLFSNWITENILATSRPTTKAIEEFDIMGQFKSTGIKSIINLQQPGEHVSCGYGNEPEGFSYRSKDFMDNDVFFYNFGWRDYGVGSLENILDMVKVMQFAVSQGKVAIHCHAGLGRTGVLIAAYLLYSNRADPNEVIHYIRSKRKGAIQTRGQLECIREFADYLNPLRIIFSTVNTNEDSDEGNSNSDPTYADFTLRQFMVRQQLVLHGQEARRLKYIPKIVYCCCQRLLELAKRGHRHEFHDHILDVRLSAPKAFENTTSDTQNGDTISNGLPRLTSRSSRIRESFTAVGFTRRSSKKTMTLSNSSSTSSLNKDGDSDIASSLMQKSESDQSEVDEFSAPDVATCMAEYEYSKRKREEVAKYKEIMNTATDNYDQLYKIQDASIVAALMYEWLDALREPVLHPQDLPAMLMHDSVVKGLHSMDKITRGVIEVIFMTVARLLPLNDVVHDDLYCRILSTLTHQNMVLNMDALYASNKSMSSRTSNDSGTMRGHLADRLMHFFVALTRHFKDCLDDGYKKRKERKKKAQKAAERQISNNSSNLSSLSRKSSDRSLTKSSSDHSLTDTKRKTSTINEETGEEISSGSTQSRDVSKPKFTLAGESDTDASNQS